MSIRVHIGGRFACESEDMALDGDFSMATAFTNHRHCHWPLFALASTGAGSAIGGGIGRWFPPGRVERAIAEPSLRRNLIRVRVF